MVSTKSLEGFNKDGEIQVTCRSKEERDFRGSAPEFGSICRVKINDKNNNRFTDAWLDLTRGSRGIQACVNHEKGYPSQDKGIAEKCISLNWLNNEPPTIEE